MSDDAARKTLLEQGLAHAQRVALLPPDANGAVVVVAEGSVLRGGVFVRAGKYWTLAGEIDADLVKKQVTGRITVIGQW